MKTKQRMSIATLALLLWASLAQAAEVVDITNQNLSSYPYQAAPNDANSGDAEQGGGARLDKENKQQNKASSTQYQKFRIHMLEQRPDMDGNQ